MSKFKVGNKVRVLANPHACNGEPLSTYKGAPEESDVVEITDLEDDDGDLAVVDDSGCEWHVHHSCVELVDDGKEDNDDEEKSADNSLKVEPVAFRCGNVIVALDGNRKVALIDDDDTSVKLSRHTAIKIYEAMHELRKAGLL